MRVMVELSPAGDRIFLVSTAAIGGLSADVRGARFSRRPQPHWSLPLTMTACRQARERFRNQLQIGPLLTAWAEEQVASEQMMEALGNASDADLVRVPTVSPVLDKAMASRTYQRVAARFVAAGRNVLIADEPGLGKTLEAIGGIIEADVPGPYLVVAPKTATHVVWGREIPRWYPGAHVVVVPDGRAKRDSILNNLVEAPGVYDGQPMVDTERLMDEHYDSLVNTWLVIHPEMMRAQRWWVCPVCNTKTKWRAGRIQLSCILDEMLIDGEYVQHPYVNPNTVEKEIDYVFPQLFKVEWGGIISDECDKMLIRKTGTPNLARTGAEELRTRPDGIRIAMSGTPTRGKPRLLWGTLNWLRPTEYTSMWRWMEQFWEISSGWGDSKQIGALTPHGAAALDRELRRIMLRRTKPEVAQDMPPKTYVGTTVYQAEAEHFGKPLDTFGLQVQEALETGSNLAIAERDAIAVWLPMDAAQKRLYDQMERMGVVELDGGRLDPLGILAEHTRLKQFATSCGKVVPTLRPSSGEWEDVFHPILPSNKFEYIMQKLEEMGFPDDPQDKVIITSQYTSILSLYEEEMRRRWGKSFNWTNMFGSCSITGAVTGKRREQTIDNFNQAPGTDSPHVLFLNVKAGGVAITLDSADHMFGVDETWNPDDETQVEDRIHRVSRPRPVFYYKLRSIGTIEARIAKANAEMAADARYVLDGRRGVEYHRAIRAAS